MEEQYIKECTKDWELVSKEGEVELWRYRDLVDWATQHCIKVKGKVKAVIEEQDAMHPDHAFELAVKLLVE